jgi:hypothetical protein
MIGLKRVPKPRKFTLTRAIFAPLQKGQPAKPLRMRGNVAPGPHNLPCRFRVSAVTLAFL